MAHSEKIKPSIALVDLKTWLRQIEVLKIAKWKKLIKKTERLHYF